MHSSHDSDVKSRSARGMRRGEGPLSELISLKLSVLIARLPPRNTLVSVAHTIAASLCCVKSIGMYRMDTPRDWPTPGIHAYRLVYPLSQYAPPQLWEYAQPYIDNLLRNARTFERFVTQWYFEDWAALDRDNTRIWNTYYRPKPLFAPLVTWQEWLPAYRQLIIDVQDMVAEHTAHGTWRRQPSRRNYPA